MKRALFLALSLPAVLAAAPKSGNKIVTYRDTGCGCCEEWVKAARQAGSTVELHDLDRTERLRRFHLTEETAGCHTSLIAGYLIEGHVPLDIVARLLRERPRIRGIAAPGMPTGIAGMGGPRSGPVDILTLEVHPRVYARIA